MDYTIRYGLEFNPFLKNYKKKLSKYYQCSNCKQTLCQRLLKLLASNAIFRKIAYLAGFPFPEFLLNACW